MGNVKIFSGSPCQKSWNQNGRHASGWLGFQVTLQGWLDVVKLRLGLATVGWGWSWLELGWLGFGWLGYLGLGLAGVDEAVQSWLVWRGWQGMAACCQSAGVAWRGCRLQRGAGSSEPRTAFQLRGWPGGGRRWLRVSWAGWAGWMARMAWAGLAGVDCWLTLAGLIELAGARWKWLGLGGLDGD